MTIMEFLQGLDSHIDYDNILSVVFSANSVKCQDTEDYWGINISKMDGTTISSYFGNASDDGLNWEGLARHNVLAEMSPVEGLRQAFTKACQGIEGKDIYIVAPNTANWMTRTLDLFKDFNVIPRKYNVHLISLQVLHKVHTDAFIANKLMNADSMEELCADNAYSRSLSLNKLKDIYGQVQMPAKPACEERCRIIKEITTDLLESWVKEEDE